MILSGLVVLLFLALTPRPDQALQPLISCPENQLELVPGGDFGESTEPALDTDPGLSPSLAFFASTPLVAGSYAVSSGTNAWGTPAADEDWIDLDADADGNPNGYMMIVSPADNAPDTIWQQTIQLCPSGTGEFEFSLQAINLTASGGGVAPNLELVIGDQTFDLETFLRGQGWVRRLGGFTFDEPDPEVTVSIVQTAAGSGGSVEDFALDNISILTCVPDLEVQPLAAPVCPGNPIALNAQVGNGFGTTYYQWQVSINGGDWEDVGSPNADPTLDVAAVPPAARYRVLASPNLPQLNQGECAITSAPLAITYDNPAVCFGGRVITNVSDQLCDGQTGANLVEGGDFGSGADTLGSALDPGITTLTHNAVDSFPQQEGQYVIAGVLDADPCDGAFPEPCWTGFERDSLDSLGYRMVIDAGAAPDIFFQATIDSLCENTTYQFSVEVLNLAAAFFAPEDPDFPTSVELPVLDFVVAPVGTSLIELQSRPAEYTSNPIPNDTTVTTVGFTFEMAPGESEILIALRNAGNSGFGNDLAIDNVLVAVCGPPSVPTYPLTCPDPPPPLTLTAEINGDQMGTDPAIQWFQLNPEGQPEEIPGANGRTLDRLIYNPGDTYGFYVATGPNELLNPNCRIESQLAVIDFLPVAVDSIQQAVCIGESVTIGNETFDETGVYRVEFPNGAANGCDSVVVLDLQVADPIRVSISEAICPGESVTVGDQEFDTPGTYEVTLQAQGGCDSIVTLNLFEDQLIFTTAEEICEGDSLEFNGNFYSTTGIFRDTLPAQIGCDTVLELDLTVLDAPRREETIELCPGDTYEGEVYFSDTTLTERVPAPSGCDSIIVINLDLGPLSGFTIQGSTILCGSGDIVLDASAENATYLWSTGATTPTIDVGTPGSYSVEVTSGTCSARDTVEVTEGDIQLTLDTIPPRCAGENSGIIQVAFVNGGQPPYTYTLNGNSQDSPLFTDLPAGAYELLVTGSGGCSVTETIDLAPAEPFTIELEDRINLVPGQVVQLNPIVNRPISAGSWSPAAGLSCTDCLNPLAGPDLTTIYSLVLFDDRGCEARDQVQIVVDNRIPVYIPNAFSPNGDGDNDFFTLYANERVRQIDRLVIFDRWGNKVFERSPLPINDESQGWNGRVNGLDSPTGVYVFFAEVTFTDDTTEVLQGDVTLLR